MLLAGFGGIENEKKTNYFYGSDNIFKNFKILIHFRVLIKNLFVVVCCNENHP